MDRAQDRGGVRHGEQARWDEAVEDLLARCAVAGLPRTAQRRAIFLELVRRDDHPTVDQVFTAVLERLPGVSRTTVYRNLETLFQLGLLRRVDHPGSAVRVDPNLEPHHHFLCSSCGAIEDLPFGSVPGAVGLAYAGDSARTVAHLGVVVHGTCAGCNGARDAR